MKTFLAFEKGTVVECGGKRYVIANALDLKNVLVKDPETGKHETLPIKDLIPFQEGSAPVEPKTAPDLSTFSAEELKAAEEWLDVLSPLLQRGGNTVEATLRVAEQMDVHISTVYRKLANLSDGERMSALIPNKSSGGAGKHRIDDKAEKIVEYVLDYFYYNKEKKKRSVEKAYQELEKQCKQAEIQPPHKNTLYNRIKKARSKRGDGPVAKGEPTSYPNHFPGADYPLAYTQIDHTPLDIIVVDEVERQPIGRPWITVLIDVFSRMVLGFYVSLDAPSNMSAGMAIAHAILPKEKWLQKMDVPNSWDCWGKMRAIHADNAGEFRGKMLRWACKEYGIDLEWRPVGKAHYGGHIERLMGTIATEIHALPGTTFSNPVERGKYNSDKHSAMTLDELEKWLAEFFTGVYHQRAHSALGMSPMRKYELGILGDGKSPGLGLPARVDDEDRLRLDLMPYELRTIQQGYGVVIEHVHYFSPILNSHLHAKDEKNASRKYKFMFRRDPRDISVTWFYDPKLKEYFEIPYLNSTNPAVNIWEYNAARKKLEEDGQKNVNETMIFETLKRMGEIQEKSVKTTKKARRNAQRRRQHERTERPKVSKLSSEPPIHLENLGEIAFDVTPFGDVEEYD